MCCLRINDVARQDQFHRLTFAHQPRETLSATTTRDDPEIDFRLTKGCRFTRDPDIAGQGQFTTAAQTVPVDHGNNWLWKSIDRGKERATHHHIALRDGSATSELGDIGAGDK